MKIIEWKFKDVENENDTKEKFDSSEKIYKLFKNYFKNKTQEEFIVLLITSQLNIRGFEVISKGTLTRTVVHTREIFRSAIVASCSGIILMHNHPSGNSSPSDMDIKLTKRLVKAGKILDIQVLDHIIFGDSFYAFSNNNLI